MSIDSICKSIRHIYHKLQVQIINVGTTNLMEGHGAGSDTVISATPPRSPSWMNTANDSWLHLNAPNQSGTGIRLLKKVSGMRQIEIAETMVSANNFFTGYGSKVIEKATEEEQTEEEDLGEF